MKWLQTEADVDRCFYRLFVKEYQLPYEKVASEGLHISTIRMKDCHVILELDNLDPLATHKDPGPGETRTSILCTLPMILKGLLRDNCISRSWYREDCIAFQGESCQCMKKTELEVGSHRLLFLSSTIRRTHEEYFLSSEHLGIMSTLGQSWRLF